MSTDARRLACFESLVEAAPATPDLEVEPVLAEATTMPAGQEAPVEQSDTVAATSRTAAVMPTVAASPAVDAPPPEAAPSSTPGSTAAANDFGAEHIEAPEEADRGETLSTTVRSVKKDRYKRLQFEFENGQVWRQTEARHFPYPKGDPFEVVISRGMLGDYQMRVGGEGRMTRIQRLK